MVTAIEITKIESNAHNRFCILDRLANLYGKELPVMWNANRTGFIAYTTYTKHICYIKKF